MAQIHTLSNGVTLVHEERPGTKKVSMTIALKSGSAHEDPSENGLTHLTQEACLMGTTTRSREQIAAEIEDKGASYGSSTNRSMSYYAAQSLSRDATDVFGVIADVVRNPVFDPVEVSKIQKEIGQWIDQKAQSPGTVAGDKFIEAAFDGHAAAKSAMGDKNIVASYTPSQLKQKHAEMLADPSEITISFAGDISLQDAIKLADDHFGDLTAQPKPAAQPPVTFKGGDIRIANNNDQMNIIFGFEAPGTTDPDRYKLMMLQELLSGGMSSPLFQEIREKRGLVYSVGASYSSIEESGIFYISAGTGKGKVGELIKVSMDLLGGAIKNGFSDDELEIARERIMRNLEGSLEKASAASTRNLSQVMNFGKISSADDVKNALENVTSDDIRRACANMLQSGNYALAGVGPQDSMPSETEIKDMMAKQVQGVTIPAPQPASLKQNFAAAAAPAQQMPSGTTLKSSKLANGMIVVTAERAGTLACGAWVGAGSDHETPVLNGATHMNEHMMFKGTPSYPPGSIDKIVEAELRGGLNAYTSRDQTAYYFYNLAADGIDKVVDICGEMVFKANLDDQEFSGKTVTNPDGSTSNVNGERDVVIEEIRRSNDNLNSRKWDLTYKTAYPNQPHGRPILGTETTLTAMTAAQLAAYRDEYYVPNNVVFSAAGPIKHDDFVALIDKKFGQMQPSAIQDLPAPQYVGGTDYIEMENAQLCSLSLLAEAVSKTDADSHAYDAFGEILGSGSSSRLQKSLVNNKGLTASIGAAFVGYRNGGAFAVMTSVAADKVKPVVNAIYEEIRNLVNNVTQTELDKVKASMEMTILTGLESNRAACDAFGRDTLAHGKPESPDDALAAVRRLTLDDIKRVGQSILASNPTLAMVVPPGTDPALLPQHQNVVDMRDGIAQNAGPAPVASQPGQP